MFACKDFKELSKGPSGTEKKDAGGKKKERKNVSVTLMSETGMQHAAYSLEKVVFCIHCIYSM